MATGRGRLIVFEGIDGTGKSTQLQWAAIWLHARGYKVATLREPTRGPHGKVLRASAQAGRLTPEDERDLFLKDREWNVRVNLRPSLDAGKVVLLDRYYYSSIAYQGARGLDPQDIRRRNEAIAPRPDLVILLDLPPEIALRRIRDSRGETPNLFENLDYLRRVRALFLALKDPAIVRIDAEPSAEIVWQQVEAVLKSLFPPVK
ncbi:MAG: dTMP kinase [Candidatus Zixiibacteriota bacterium]|nr:MAG: dTMP kinase [candidate division Zixibacteria bacterium]